jgi:mannose/cellobiose epimerase-like protein (N-acyl-D-glucosamine 2-epimerase family)
MFAVRSAFSQMERNSLVAVADEARSWLFDHLLPLWSANGRDPAGGYHDQLDASGAVRGLPKRCRVQTRQIYVFAEAGRMGWTGPWRECVDHGVAFLRSAFQREDGFMRCKVSGAGDVLDDSIDNYDQAFALFALAKAYAATGDRSFMAQALELLAVLRRERAHAFGGFHETIPPSMPLRSNPHMHMFEASVAWVEAAQLDEFRALADEISELCRNYFVHGEHCALLECFDLDWKPLAEAGGHVAEPGHQFEWAWLLLRWHALGGVVDLELPRRLHAFAKGYGVDHDRGVAINEVYHDGRLRDGNARLWPQTERLKAALAMLQLGEESIEDVVAAWAGLKLYFLPSNRALFRDKLRVDGRFHDEAAFASSLYHITCAISELVRVSGSLAEPVG